MNISLIIIYFLAQLGQAYSFVENYKVLGWEIEIRGITPKYCYTDVWLGLNGTELLNYL